MRLRVPRFAIVLTVLIAPVSVAAVMLESAGGAHSELATMLGSGPARACVRAQAIAHADLSAVVQTSGGPVVLGVRRDAVVSERACADGDSGEGARSTALNLAYSKALAGARRRAQSAAHAALARVRAGVVARRALGGAAGDQAAVRPARASSAST